MIAGEIPSLIIKRLSCRTPFGLMCPIVLCPFAFGCPTDGPAPNGDAPTGGAAPNGVDCAPGCVGVRPLVCMVLISLLMLNLRASSTTASSILPPLTGIGGNGSAHTLANESKGCCPPRPDALDCCCAICVRVSCAINANPTLTADRARY